MYIKKTVQKVNKVTLLTTDWIYSLRIQFSRTAWDESTRNQTCAENIAWLGGGGGTRYECDDGGLWEKKGS